MILRFGFKNKKYRVDLNKFLTSSLITLCIIYTICDLTFSVVKILYIHAKEVIEYIPAPAIEYIEYEVCAGDTLWEIAEEIYPDRDNREIIWLIQNDNACSADLKIGQILKIRKI